MQGWVKLHRQLLESPLFTSEPFSKGQAWIALIMLTNHKEGYITVKNGNLLKIERGECGYSELALSKIFKWSRGKVKRFLILLENEKMIQQKIIENHSIIKILNYETYQDDTTNSTTNSTTNGQQTVQQTDTNKNDKNDKNDKNEEEVVVVEEEKKKIACNFYGEFSNVYLSQENYDKLEAFILNKAVLAELIEELSAKISKKSDRYKPYDENFPNAHYLYLKDFWEFRKNNPAKFMTVSDTGGDYSNKIESMMKYLQAKDKNK